MHILKHNKDAWQQSAYGKRVSLFRQYIFTLFWLILFVYSLENDLATNEKGLFVAATGGLLTNAVIRDGLAYNTVTEVGYAEFGTSLAVAYYVKNIMKERNVKGSFASGGITGYFTQMLEEGLFENLYDVQCFDLDGVLTSFALVDKI